MQSFAVCLVANLIYLTQLYCTKHWSCLYWIHLCVWCHRT